MTRVCLVGASDLNLKYELLSRETARNALATYDLHEPYANAVALETVSLGAAVSLLNDLNWYLVRFTDAVFVKDPSISESEWLSRALATAVRDDEIAPAASDRFLRVYGVIASGTDSSTASSGDRGGETTPATTTVDSQEPGRSADASEGATAGESAADPQGPPELVEPMLVTRTGDRIPEYDLRDVEDTLVVRVTESEFGA
jgi:hypothetical protein